MSRQKRSNKYPENFIVDMFSGYDEEIAMFLKIPDVEKRLEYSINRFLNAREIDILNRYYRHMETLKSISESQGVTIERIRQIRCKALRKLKRVGYFVLKNGIEKYEERFHYKV